MKTVHIDHTKPLRPMCMMQLPDISTETVQKAIINRIKDELEDIIYQLSHSFKKIVQFPVMYE